MATLTQRDKGRPDPGMQEPHHGWRFFCMSAVQTRFEPMAVPTTKRLWNAVTD
jgi:hypothetical protein